MDDDDLKMADRNESPKDRQTGSSKSLQEWFKSRKSKKGNRSKADTGDAIIATHAQISERCPLAALMLPMSCLRR